MNWPFVTRARFDALDWALRRVRLEREVLTNELSHCQRSKREMLGRLAALHKQVLDLERERDAWHAEAVK
jgi:hypothetical protein